MKMIKNEFSYNMQLLKEFYWLSMRHVFIFLILASIFVFVLGLVFTNGTFLVLGIILLLFSLLYLGFMPIVLAKTNYQRLLERSSGKEVMNRVCVADGKIIIENVDTHNKVEYSLSSVRKIKEGKHIICLITKARVAIMFSKDGFLEGTQEDLYSLLKK